MRFTQQQIVPFLNSMVKKDYYTISLSISRVFLALCTLLTLIFNTDNELLIELNKDRAFNLNIFQLFNDLFISRIVCYTILFLVILGWYPRITCLLHSWVAYSFLLSSKLIEGGDQITHILVILLVPILLFDTRKNHWKKTEIKKNFYVNTILFFSDLLIKIQFFIVYFFASIGKFTSVEWRNGTALYYWFSDSVFGLNNTLNSLILPLFKNGYFLAFSTWGVLIIELLIAYAVLTKSNQYRKYIFILGVIFHFFIGLFFGLWSFYFAMLGLLTYVLFNSFNFSYDTKILSKD